MKFFKNKWFVILLVLAITIIVIQYLKSITQPYQKEGFTQNTPFLLKTNDRIYDSFYAMIYDDLHLPQKSSDFAYKRLLSNTQPSTQNSVFLDVGCGTGHLVNNLKNAGYKAFGIDKSQAMLDVSEKLFPDIETKCGDVKDPLTFNKGTFTHITCMDFTIYHIEDKVQFFSNCYYWLKPNGYLIVHLVDKLRFSPVVPAGNPLVNDNPQKYSKQRINETKIDFIDFVYDNKYSFDKKNSQVLRTESFTDKKSGNVRQNEMTLYMEELDNIVYMARRCGFIAHSQVKYPNDDYQYIYIFERTM